MKKAIRKIGQVLLAFVPTIVTLGLQIAVTIPVTFYYFGALGYMGKLPKFGMDITNWLNDILSSDYTVYVTVVWGTLSMIIFILWYYRLHDRSGDVALSKTLNLYSVGGMILIVVGMQVSIEYFYTIAEKGLPDIFQQYQQLMDMSNYGTIATLIMVIYGIVVAPIHEEYLNRGVTLHFADRAMPFFAANIFQALLFGIIHMNLVQGSYAFIIGLALGYIYRVAKNIWVPILFHMMFNLFGTFVPMMPLSTDKTSAYVFVGVLGLVISISGFVLFNASLRMRDENL
ncbi:MAG: CPBP family intramembrane metalloprotease [Lachnospiraceae bacterium]|nr:CPBP family intramembrane metalloprotease [Lachnospiraceae bacterium]